MKDFNWLKEIVVKTKAGKVGAVFLIITVFCLFAGIMGVMEDAHTSFIPSFLISVFCFCKGENTIRKQSAPFNPTKKIGKLFWIDTKNKSWSIPQGKEGKTVYTYSDLDRFELQEDGSTISGGSMGSTVAGGLLFGAVGALAGSLSVDKAVKEGCRNMQIIVYTKNEKTPVRFIDIITTEVKKSDPIYRDATKAATEIVALLNIITEQNNNA